MQPTGILEKEKATNPLKTLAKYGQSVWLDYIRRDLIETGELQRLIEDDGLSGMTSNPSIFEKAIVESKYYTDLLKSLAGRNDLNAAGRYELLAIRDIQDAADALRTVYQSTRRRDGYISLEVSPLLAHDTDATLKEARRLWKAVGRENVMIKVPGTREGIPAFAQLISEGININVTLLFAQDVYEQVADAYIAGLGNLAAKGGDVSKIASVASFFISRIDTLVDSIIQERLKTVREQPQRSALEGLFGKVAIANGKQTYQRYLRIFRGEGWEQLAKQGARTQRVLWASTSTKNPKYRDVMYVEELIGADTVNTIPPATMDAYRDHGKGRASLTEDVESANQVMESVARLGISMKEVTDKLTDDGVQLFADSFTKLLEAVETTSKAQR